MDVVDAVVVSSQGLRARSADDVTAPLPDEREFLALYRAVSRPLWAYLYRMAGDRSDADDLLQETFLRYVQAPLPTRDEGEVRAYLYRIASNLAIDRWRRRGRESSRVEAPGALPDVPGAENASESLALRHDMARTFRNLKPKDRALLWLAYVEGSKHDEIATALGLKPGSVPVMLMRARKKLAGLLRGKGWGG